MLEKKPLVVKWLFYLKNFEKSQKNRLTTIYIVLYNHSVRREPDREKEGKQDGTGY